MHVPTLYCSLQTNHCINFIDDGGEIERHNIVAINWIKFATIHEQLFSKFKKQSLMDFIGS